MKTAEELHDYIQNTVVQARNDRTPTMLRIVDVLDELNDRCRVLESRLAVAEAKLSAGQENKLSETPLNQPGSKAWY